MDFRTSTGMSICRTSRKLHQHLEHCFQPYDVTPGQWSLVRQLQETPGISQKQLADLLEKDQNNVKALVDRLVRKNLVERRRSLEDQRAFELFLTAHGLACFDRVVSVDDTFMDSVLTGLSPAEIDTFTRLLRKIENNVSD